MKQQANLSLKNTVIRLHFKMFFRSFAHQLNKIYLAASNSKTAETSISQYYFVFINCIFVRCFNWNNYYHNPQGLNQFILPPGLFESFSKKIINYSFSQHQAEFKTE